AFVEKQLACIHPLHWRSIARTYRTQDQVDSSDDCQKLCHREDQCTHFNYQTETKQCELKIKNGSDVVNAQHFVTGPKTCDTSCFLFGKGYSSPEIAKPEKKFSAFDCQSWCRDTNGCAHFTFNTDSGTCFLKGSDAPGTEREYPGDLSGPRDFCKGEPAQPDTSPEKPPGELQVQPGVPEGAGPEQDAT
ncbi:pan domain-containing protein, partial [Cystoisospora suis]